MNAFTEALKKAGLEVDNNVVKFNSVDEFKFPLVSDIAKIKVKYGGDARYVEAAEKIVNESLPIDKDELYKMYFKARQNYDLSMAVGENFVKMYILPDFERNTQRDTDLINGMRRTWGNTEVYADEVVSSILDVLSYHLVYNKTNKTWRIHVNTPNLVTSFRCSNNTDFFNVLTTDKLIQFFKEKDIFTKSERIYVRVESDGSVQTSTPEYVDKDKQFHAAKTYPVLGSVILKSPWAKRELFRWLEQGNKVNGSIYYLFVKGENEHYLKRYERWSPKEDKDREVSN